MPPTPQAAVRLMVDPYDPENQRRGTVLIVNSPFGGADPYLALYRDRVEHERNPLVKAASLCGLGRYGGPQDAPRVAACLADKNCHVRWEAAKALQRLHNPAVVPALLRRLRDDWEQPDTRIAVACALGQYAQDRVFQGLIAALDEPELALNLCAHHSLVTLTGEDFGLDASVWLRWYRAVADPFAGQKEYLYPTYQPEETWLEKLAFWSSKKFEQPAAPAGLRPELQRRTYQQDHEPAACETEDAR